MKSNSENEFNRKTAIAKTKRKFKSRHYGVQFQKMKDMNTIKLRAHHLLCLQGYNGKGYSPAFVDAMTKISKTLINDANTNIFLVEGADDICASCPFLKNNKCAHENPPEAQDSKVLKYFGLAPNNDYNYNTLAKLIRNNINEGIFSDICGTCDWDNDGECRKAMGLLKS